MSFEKQRGEYDCFLASLASALGQQYEALWTPHFREIIEAAKGTYGDNTDKAFEYAQMKVNQDYWTIPVSTLFFPEPKALFNLLRGRRALIQVPSLNNPPPAQHIVYWTGHVLHDPSNKQTYRWTDQLKPQYVWLFNETQ